MAGSARAPAGGAHALALAPRRPERRAQIYRWTDADGDTHFSQGVDSVPVRFRAGATVIGYDSPSPASSGPRGGGATPSGTGRITFSPGQPIMVTARVNGGGSAQLMLDTGRRAHGHQPTVLAALGVSYANVRRASLKGVTGDAQVDGGARRQHRGQRRALRSAPVVSPRHGVRTGKGRRAPRARFPRQLHDHDRQRGRNRLTLTAEVSAPPSSGRAWRAHGRRRGPRSSRLTLNPRRCYRLFSMDYKDTLNLPKTAFPMKANLPKREPRDARALGGDGHLRQDPRRRRRSARCGSSTTARPTPTATSTWAHRSTRCSRTSSSSRARCSGINAVYVPGWDCHGLPIEHQVEKELGGQARTCAGHGPVERSGALPATTPRRFVDIQRDGVQAAGRASATGTTRT